MELLTISGGYPGGHRLDALALARPKQPLKIDRCPTTLLDAAEPSGEGSEPSLKGRPPVG